MIHVEDNFFTNVPPLVWLHNGILIIPPAGSPHSMTAGTVTALCPSCTCFMGHLIQLIGQPCLDVKEPRPESLEREALQDSNLDCYITLGVIYLLPKFQEVPKPGKRRNLALNTSLSLPSLPLVTTSVGYWPKPNSSKVGAVVDCPYTD